MESKYIAGIILVGIFISLPGWFLLWSSPILGATLIILSIIIQQWMVKAAKKEKLLKYIEQEEQNPQEPKRYKLEDLN